ncbi:MAG TPA: TetR/AcrR family transcriptional regulator [Polyangiaceae bacterium]
MRKRPRQERSEATVDAILEGASRLFVAEGYAAATTNRIAQSAGISVGSLYQYFPSKDAIAVELVRRFRANRVAFLESQLKGADAQPLESITRTLFTSFLKAEGIRPELYSVLIEQVLRTSARKELRGYEERLEGLVAGALRKVQPPPKVEDVDLAAFMLVRLVLALVHSVNADRPRYNTPMLVKELTRLVMAYLGG